MAQMRLTTEQAIKRLDALEGDDPEATHADADDILQSVVHPDVEAAYNRAAERCGGWWYA